MYRNPASSEAIRAAFLKTGMTQRELAAKLNVSEQTIHAYVTGYRKPSAGNLFALARALNVDVRDLMVSEAA
jgi:transcriptional regulator with XRE-family HTH domain